MFQGPHAYISFSWYKQEDVPTWNYQSVHLYGSSRLLNEQELEDDLIRLLKTLERNRKNAALWENLSAGTKKQIKGIVGFRVNVKEVEATYKLSQNRTEADYQNIIDNLYEEEEINSHQLAEVMKKNR